MGAGGCGDLFSRCILVPLRLPLLYIPFGLPPPSVREMQERCGLLFRILLKMSYLLSSTTPTKLTYRINGEKPLAPLPGKWEKIGALNRNKLEKLD